jgi:hypothetical protein
MGRCSERGGADAKKSSPRRPFHHLLWSTVMQLTQQIERREEDTPSALPAPGPDARPRLRERDFLVEAQDTAWEILSRLPVTWLR